MVLFASNAPKDNELKEKYISFIHLSALRGGQSGFDILTGARIKEFEYELSCLLLGQEGDCSDRDELITLAEGAQKLFEANGYDAALAYDEEIDGRLSRPACVLRLKKTFCETGNGGS